MNEALILYPPFSFCLLLYCRRMHTSSSSLFRFSALSVLSFPYWALLLQSAPYTGLSLPVNGSTLHTRLGYATDHLVTLDCSKKHAGSSALQMRWKYQMKPPWPLNTWLRWKFNQSWIRFRHSFSVRVDFPYALIYKLLPSTQCNKHWNFIESFLSQSLDMLC